jgi:hypothetical protein
MGIWAQPHMFARQAQVLNCGAVHAIARPTKPAQSQQGEGCPSPEELALEAVAH